MNDNAASAQVNDLRMLLPSINELMITATGLNVAKDVGNAKLAEFSRHVIEHLRTDLMEEKTPTDNSRDRVLVKAEQMLLDEVERDLSRRQIPVINATGVIVHTNLGRAPLSDAAREAIASAIGYSSVEYDLKTGKRGRRGGYVEDLLCELTGAEAAVIVNNCAAAALLVLTVLAEGKEVVISRGELVEIGGDFRVPDVLERSGATLREIGTTNRTKLADYEKAIGENAGLILRVHPSNYRIIGFTATPTNAELAELAHRHGLVFYEDAGSGALIDLSEHGLEDEPLISRSISDGADIVTFSGDKLLGGPQAGLIVGRRDLIDRIRKHPMYRALRSDKLTYAALEATLGAYSRGSALREIPVLRMLSMTRAELDERTRKFAASLPAKGNLIYEIIDGSSVVGGGSAPAAKPDTALLALTHKIMSANEFEGLLRKSKPPVIARIIDNKVVLDLRTVSETEEKVLLEILKSQNRER
jgi:L-seryl-tRNA(Ser) seleniumtransferase